MESGSDLWQLVFVDALFLLMAVGLGLWFRAWLREQTEAFDRRLGALEAQQASIERLGQRLAAAIEGLQPGGRRTTGVRSPTRPKEGRDSEYLQGQARELLARGMAPEEVARSLDIGIAEVELLRRVLRRGA